MAFVDWVEKIHQVTDHRMVEAHADEWVCQYLQELIEQGKSPYTLHTIRSALRMVFGQEIASSVAMPKRKRSEIKRSRRPVKMDACFQPDNWPEHILFAKATGLRRAEMREVRVRDITRLPNGTVSVHVHRGKTRDVTVLAGYEPEVLAMVEGRSPDERLFRHIPKNMDVQSYRLASAQARYQQLAPGSTLPAADVARIKPSDYNTKAAQTVSESLGHRNRATILKHYLRE